MQAYLLILSIYWYIYLGTTLLASFINLILMPIKRIVHTTLALHIHISLIKAFIFSKSFQTLTVLLIVSVSRPVLDQQLYLVVNLNCMSPKHYFMSLLRNWFYCIKLDIPKPIRHSHNDLHWQHFVCDNMAVTCIGKKLPNAEGNILSTQYNVIQPMSNHF